MAVGRPSRVRECAQKKTKTKRVGVGGTYPMPANKASLTHCVNAASCSVVPL